MANLHGLPLRIRHLWGEPSPEALWAIFRTVRDSRRRNRIAARYFGRRKTGPKPLPPTGDLQVAPTGRK